MYVYIRKDLFEGIDSHDNGMEAGSPKSAGQVSSLETQRIGDAAVQV